MSYGLRGLGVSNEVGLVYRYFLAPSAASPAPAEVTRALDCGSNIGAWLDPECWCYWHPWVCSTETAAAVNLRVNPDLIKAPMPPPPVGAPVGNTPDVGVIDDLLAEQMRAWQALNAQTIQESADNIAAANAPDGKPSSGVPMWVWLAGGVAVFGVVALSAGGPRRYGR